MSEPLVVIKFQDGSVSYLANFKIKIEGDVYQRHLKAASEIIQIFKACSKDDHASEATGGER